MFEEEVRLRSAWGMVEVWLRWRLDLGMVDVGCG